MFILCSKLLSILCFLVDCKILFYFFQITKGNKKKNNGFKRKNPDFDNLVDMVLSILPSATIFCKSKDVYYIEELSSYRKEKSVFYELAKNQFSDNSKLVLKHSKLFYKLYISDRTAFLKKYVELGGSVKLKETKEEEKVNTKLPKTLKNACQNLTEKFGANITVDVNCGVKIKDERSEFEETQAKNERLADQEGMFMNPLQNGAEIELDLLSSLKSILDVQKIQDFKMLFNRVVEGVTIDKVSLESLQPNECLWNTVLDPFSLLCEKVGRSLGSSILYLGTECMWYISEGYIPNFIDWMQLPDLYESRVWLMPVNERKEHWTLYIVEFEKKKIIYCNSVSVKPVVEETVKLCAFLEKFCAIECFQRGKIDWNEWILVAANDLPPQRLDIETNNCGLHVLMYILIICLRTNYFYNDDVLTTVFRYNVANILSSTPLCLDDRSKRQRAVTYFESPEKKLVKKKGGRLDWTSEKVLIESAKIPCRVLYESVEGNTLNYLAKLFNS